MSDQTIQCAQTDTSRQLARNGPPALSVQLFHQGNGQLKAEPKGAGPAPAAAELSSGSRPSRSDVPVSGDRMAPGTTREVLGPSYLTLTRLTSGTISLMFYLQIRGWGGRGVLKCRHTLTHARVHRAHATPTCFLGHRGSKRTVSPLVFLFFILIS